VIVVQVPQGYYKHGGDARFLVETLLTFAATDDQFLLDQPQCRKYHRQAWAVLDVSDDAKAPWGHEWYRVGEHGYLQFHSAEYDSSD